MFGFLEFLIVIIFQLNLQFSTAQYDPLPPGENLLETNLFYENLYNRLKANDFGFAKFGQPCDELSVEELENILELVRLIIQDQEEDGAYRRTVEEHLRPKLKYLLYRFQLHCDYRKFQTCDKRHKTCACPHASMGPGRNEVCGFNLGKSCGLSQEKLISLGVLIPFSEKANVSCLGRAECVSSFGAAERLCRCPIGYHSNCKHSVNLPAKAIGSGRSFSPSNSTRDQTLWDIDHTETIMFPSELKSELIKLMNLRRLFAEADRVAEAESLYFKMESDADKEDMVIKDILIRRLASLTFGAACDPDKQAILDNPPLAVEENTWIDPKPEDIKNWQISLLDGQAMCSYTNYFRCDSNLRTCVCKDGLEIENFRSPKDKKRDGGCYLKVGQSCHYDYTAPFEFDPLRDMKRFSTPYPPLCVSQASCRLRAFIFAKQCWCKTDLNSTECDNSEELRSNKIIDKIVDRFTLQYEDDCDPIAHAGMFNPQEPARSRLSDRLDQLQGFLDTPNLRFCDLDSLIRCNATTKKCQCFDRLLLQGESCNIRNMDNCGDAYIIGKDFYLPKGELAGMKLWKIEQVFEKKLSPLCVKNAVCSEETSKCTCTNNLAGPSCEDQRSVFAQVLSPFKVKGYSEDRNINPVLHDLNYYTAQIESMMTLRYGDTCSNNYDERLNRIISFYRVVGNSDEKISGSKTLHQYEKASLWAKEFTVTVGPAGAELCNAYLGFTCHETGKCRCIKGTTFEDNECKLNAGAECDEHPVAGWMQSCRKNSECVSDGPGAKSICVCSKGWSGPSCQQRVNEEVKGIEGPGQTTEDTIAVFEQIDELITEIINRRSIGLDEICNVDEESQLTNYFPTLPHWNLEEFGRLPNGHKQTYYKLRQIYNTGQKFCSRREYLMCDNGKCQCGNQYGLVREGNNCRLKEFSHCGEINTIYDHDFPIPLCMKGTKCTKLDFGMYKCIKIPESRERW